MQLCPRAVDGTGVCVQSASTAAIDQTRGVRIRSGCVRVRAPRLTRFRRAHRHLCAQSDAVGPFL